jgi:hypothetical protein
MSNLDKGDSRLLIRYCQQYGLLRNQAAYVLGTVSWETGGRMVAVRETFAESDESAVARLERAWSSGQLTWVKTPYWREGWFGRGHVQLTHERNYQRAGANIGVDLVSNPDKMLDASVSAQVCVLGMRDGWFTGKKLSDYITLKKSNYRGARRIVNGTDKASVIAELAREYEGALISEGYGVEKAPPIVNERRDGTEARDHPAQSTTIQQTLVAFLAMLSQISETAKGVVGQVSEAIGVSPEVALVVVGGLSLAYIFRERLAKFAAGVR